jgi:hypothetical protein
MADGPPSLTRAEPRIDVAVLERWLVAMVGADGSVASWSGPRAFAYPEAGGLLLRWLVEAGSAPGCADAIAGWLTRCVLADAVGRAGRRYAFDLGIVLAGLLTHSRVCGEHSQERDAIAVGMDRLATSIVQGRAIEGDAPPRWSTRFGPHLRKLASCIDLAAARIGPRSAARLRERLWVTTGAAAFDPRAPTPGADATYLHACLYALEGTLLLAAQREDASAIARIAESAHWLATLQRADGAMPAWAAKDRGFGPARADATAQAVRLWAWLDRDRHDAAITRGRAWLARAVVPGQGVRYGDDVDDVNTWATLFTLQALAFADGHVAPDGLL